MYAIQKGELESAVHTKHIQRCDTVFVKMDCKISAHIAKFLFLQICVYIYLYIALCFSCKVLLKYGCV